MLASRIASPAWRRWIAGGAVVGVGAATVVACTGDDDSAPTTLPAPTTTTTAPRRVSDGVLTIGLLLPQSGEGATLGDSLLAGAERAIAEINDAGGVRGTEVRVERADEGDTAVDAAVAVEQLVDRDVDAVVGPASSTITLEVLSTLVDAEVLTCSPTATALALDDFPDDDLFVRTAPSDSLQANAIAQRAEDSGTTSASIVYLDDLYGRPFADVVAAEIAEVGLEVRDQIPFAAADEDLSDEVERLAEGDPGVVVVLADADQGAQLLDAMVAGFAEGRSPDIVLNDAMLRPRVHERIQAMPAAMRERLRTVAPSALTEELAGPFAVNAYDCVNLIALAAQLADSDAAGDLADQMEIVTAGGSSCRDFPTCVRLTAEERQIDYDGPGGFVQIDSSGDLERARYDVYEFEALGVERIVATITATA